MACGTGQLSFRLARRAGLMAAAGFKVYSKWSAEGFAGYIAEHGFAVEKTETLGGSLAPLCYLAAKREDRHGKGTY